MNKTGCGKVIPFFLMALGSSAVTAGTMGAEIQDSHWVVSLSGGAVWAAGGETQTFDLTPTIEKTYLAQKSTNTIADGELFLGMQKTLSNELQAQFGIAVAVTGDAKMSGEIWDDADARFNNHTYQYKVNHSHVAFKGKLLLDRGYFVTPWLSGSLGVGFNKAKDFTNTPIIFEALVNPNFASNTKTAFTYTVGVGVQKALNANWQIGIGYEFADWGKSQLGSALGQTLNSGLALSHLYTNGALINITYVM